MCKVHTYKELLVFRKAYGLAMEIFELSKGFPKVETFSLTDQIRRSSRSVPANIAEAYKRRIYPKMFIAKITDCESESVETQVWLSFGKDCKYLDGQTYSRLNDAYDEVLSMLAAMRLNFKKWT